MNEDIRTIENLCAAYAVELLNHGNGHIQMTAHGCLANYYPESKNRTVFCEGVSTKHCSPYDAIKIVKAGGVAGLRPRKRDIAKNVVEGGVEPVRSKSVVKHLYSGERPPWEFPTVIRCFPDMLRLEALRLLDQAEQQERQQ